MIKQDKDRGSMVQKATTPTNDYQTLNAELDGVLVALQASDLAIDEATKLYERGLELTKLLEKQLVVAENRLHTLQLAASGMVTETEA